MKTEKLMQKVSVDKVLQMAEDVESLVFQLKAVEFDPFIHYGWASQVPLDVLDTNGNAARLFPPAASLSPCYAARCEKVYFNIEGRGGGKSEANRLVLRKKLEELMRVYIPPK